MSKKLKKQLARILAGALCFAICFTVEKLHVGVSDTVLLMAYLVTYFIIGNDVIKGAAENIIHGQVFDEKFLMAIATVGAFLISEYPEAVAVMLFYQIGEWFQSYAVNKSRKSIKELMNIRPDYANVYKNGELETVDPEEVQIGDVIVVKPGEKIPLDGTVIKGESSLDTMALTGESMPRDVSEGETVISGCVNLSGLIEVEVSKEFGESTVSKILNLVENATSKKAETENFITVFARYYTPVIVILAAILAVIPSLVTGQWTVWVYRALSFLVISCPCALVISIPLSFFGGIGAAGKNGILVKGSNYLEALSKAEIVVMDKTGTLTQGKFAVTQIEAENGDEQTLLQYAAYAERFSNHPIAQCLLDTLDKRGIAALQSLADTSGKTTEIAGFGVTAEYDDTVIAVGNEKLMKRQLGETMWQQIEADFRQQRKEPEGGTVCHISRGGTYMGYLLIEDELKEDAKVCVSGLKKEGIRKVVMLTGDRETVAKKVAAKVGVDAYYAELLPADKVECVEQIFTERSQQGKLVFVGDGINDAPVLARSDIGIAMGGLGSDAAIEAADVVIMTDEPSKILTAMRISKKTLVIVRQNILFAIGVKALVLLLAAVGVATMWAAVFADVGVAFLAILNAMRALKLK